MQPLGETTSCASHPPGKRMTGSAKCSFCFKNELKMPPQTRLLSSRSFTRTVLLSSTKKTRTECDTGIPRSSLAASTPRSRSNFGSRSVFGSKSGSRSLFCASKGDETQVAAQEGTEEWFTKESIELATVIVESYKKECGKTLLEADSPLELARKLWNLPEGVLAHDKFLNFPIRFTYANTVALEAFEASWDELVGMESTKSAHSNQLSQSSRNSIVDGAADKGSASYSKVERVSLKGNTFSIEEGVLFNLTTTDGKKVGQAAVIFSWKPK